MSHFLGYVFGSLENLDMYDENMEVEPYISKTKDEAIKYAFDYYVKAIEYCKNDIKELKDQIENDGNNLIYLNTSLAEKEVQLKKYSELIKSPKACYDEYYSDNLKDKDGNILSTYNPDSKWDWYAEAGRWEPCFKLIESDFDEDTYSTSSNCNEIDWDKVDTPFCFVDAYGEWHERGSMGWFAMVDNEKEEANWEAEFRNYVKTIKDTDILVTQIDFHI